MTNGAISVVGRYAYYNNYNYGVNDTYTPDTNSWAKTDPIGMATSPRSDFAVAHVPVNGVQNYYAIGGTVVGYVDSEVDKLIQGGSNWSYSSGLPTKRTGVGAVGGSDGFIYAVGGDSVPGIYHATTLSVSVEVDKLDPITNKWTVLTTSLPNAREHIAVVASDHYIYAIGGDGNDSAHISDYAHANEVDRFDVNTPTAGWTSVATLPNGRSGIAATVDAFGRIYAIGGWTANGSYSNEVDVYDPGVNSWTTVANLPVSRGGRAAVAGSDGGIYAFGGVDSSGIASPNVYAYAPAPVTPVLSWTPSGSLTYDNVLTTSQLDATASVAGKQVTGNFSYRDGTTQVTAGTVLSAGVHQLVATYTTSNPNIVSGGTVTATINVAQATPTVSVTDAGGKYSTDPFPATDASVTGVGKDGKLASFGDPTLSYSYYSGTTLLAGAPTAAGAYTVVAHYTSNNLNYTNADSSPVSFTIAKADASVLVNGYSGVYDGQAHGASLGHATGVGGVDLSGGVALGASFTNVPGGTAHWTFSDANYKDQSGDVAIVINKADATVLVDGYTGVYDGAAHGATGSCSGIGGVDLPARSIWAPASPTSPAARPTGPSAAAPTTTTRPATLRS